MPCGVGIKTRTRKCIDLAHHNKELDPMECINESSKPMLKDFIYQEQKCDMGGCAGKKTYFIYKKRYPL